ncbi:tryptophan tryptophylquinone biosynthesis enzyme MauG [Bradyrhizobium sacchari]|uniref:Methylamine utilization protein MauG n=1 Tax=Bradyrhizobium sacchari TaxID=1399419 RepID=A0A560KCD5_9BRAD|nr:cytochrome c peroxidase [Bradyrhizobium sacchari]OPZ00265.1 tryptophan tryptophylquinone biosynthesis enzyme MauG [Bradyrhizobium sacchari]TWB64664.1 cytochrome c peroxidase [Bradyrhizobium sacchari]TWB80988.1 cytochrome c peroxidase [Bradyrhizobium sacchari]
MRVWVSLALLAAFFPLSQPFASAAAETPAEAVERASYRRPAAVPFPNHNPYTIPKAALGERLFFDPLLSKSRARSCATCHNPSLSWGDGLARAIGEDPKGLPFRAPTLIDVAFTELLGWDGKFKTLEAVTFGPITGRANMNLTEAELIARLSAIPAYKDAFAAAFGDGAITRPRIEAALATFERTIVAGEAPFDRWIMGDETAISAPAKRGFEIFNGKAHCSKCHAGPSFTDGSFHDIGVAKNDDLGRGRLFPRSQKLRYAFKTPTLRDVARRAPYMHDGSVATLEEVIELYDRGGIDRPSLSPSIKPLSLTESEKADLIAFLQTLTASSTDTTFPKLAR